MVIMHSLGSLDGLYVRVYTNESLQVIRIYSVHFPFPLNFQNRVRNGRGQTRVYEMPKIM